MSLKVISLMAASLWLALPLAADSPSAVTWREADRPWAWSFPRDHGAHPDFKTEWWYFTGNLQDSAGRKFGYQLTIFRQGVQFTPAQPDSKWAVRDVYFGHFTISDIAADKFHVAERVSRGSLEMARAGTGSMDVSLGPWSIVQDADETIHLSAREDNMALDFDARPEKPLVLEGVNGLSRKSSEKGGASYYYSYPRLKTMGKLEVGGRTYSVSGQSWFDHEFSTSLLGRNEVGWDWFCLQLDNHEELMLYAMRDKSGEIDPVSEGTWVSADGKPQRLEPGSFVIQKLKTWQSPRRGATYPSQWRILVPGQQLSVVVTPAMADQELNLSKMGTLSYWEGACTIAGTKSRLPVNGVGYTELTGYAGALNPGLK